MPSIKILRDTFSSLGTNKYGHEIGTCEVQIGSKTVTANATRHTYGVSVAGFVGRYRTSMNAWPASVSAKDSDDKLYVNFGRDDRSGRFNKQDAISWEPDTYATMTNAEFYVPVETTTEPEAAPTTTKEERKTTLFVNTVKDGYSVYAGKKRLETFKGDDARRTLLAFASGWYGREITRVDELKICKKY